ncbi:lck-interacting transmembrane adapter 1 isoform X2 [Sus scrofa]|uniref:Lck interacting transmembrane adaptor 1 n=1 Tax=Sus scrofa TaxID=9823 RepID=A0A8D1GV89_PIG|nr:lck-interacting transmembrane adapter 1 isoform X2 [Sus scrofa]
MAAGEPVACGSPDWNLPVSGLSCRDHGRALARSQLACPSSSAMPCLTCHVPTGQAEHTHTRTPLAGAEGGALRPRPLGLRRREGLPSPGVSCVLSQSAQGGRGRGSRRCRSGAASGCRVPWPQHPDLCPQACPRLCRMRPQGSSASPALWVLGCLTLLLWLWVLCTACHRRRAGRQVSRLQGMQGGGMPTKASLLRPPHLCSLSKSDTRLHELCRGQPCSRAPRPASVDLLCPQWLEVSRGKTRPPEAFSLQELPAAVPFTDPEATYSNVGLAVIPRARLAFGSGVWVGAHSCARLGPEARPVASEYACIQKLKGTGQVPQGLGQGRAEVIPANQVDSLYSKVSKPKRRDPGPASDQPDPKGGGTVLALGGDLAYDALPPKSVGVNGSFLENVYESIQEMGGPGASKL